MNDPVSRACLVAIALSLAVLAVRASLPSAWATEALRCEITGPITVQRFEDGLKVEVSSAFSSPGSSSSSPLHVQVQP